MRARLPAAAARGGALVDTCPLPTGAFLVTAAPSPGANTTRRRVAIGVPTGAPAGLYTVDYYGNGSFYAETMKRFSLVGDSWSNAGVAEEQ